MTGILSVAILSLMLPLRINTGFVLLRPFELLMLFALALAFGRGRWRSIRIPTGLLMLVPFFFWHVISAASADAINGVREGLQVAVVAAFAFIVTQECRSRTIERMAKPLLWGMTLITAGSIVWHVSQGHLVGWKELLDAKLTFTFLPPLLAGMMIFATPERRHQLRLGWIALAPILVLSGERKALIVYLFISALMLARGRILPLMAAVMAGFAGLLLMATMIDNPYVQRQLNTLIDPAATGDYAYVLATGQYRPGDTPSQVQRAFAFSVSKQLFSENPFFGVGTNQYTSIIAEQYPRLPPALALSIHGEFQRVLTENGIIGFLLFGMIWVVSWLRLGKVLKRNVPRFTPLQARALPLLFFVPISMSLGSEAPGTRSFVALIIISLLPEIVGGILAGRRALSGAPIRAVRRLHAGGAAPRPIYGRGGT